MKGYDYSTAGAYYITICTQERLCLFGEIHDGVMHLNDAGHMVQNYWLHIPKRFPNVTMDEFVVMPNHLHGIIEISNPTVFPAERDADRKNKTLGRMLGAFKSEATNAYIAGVKERDGQPFNKKLFQRDYWEHIIRNAEEYRNICGYMACNPSNWRGDSLHL